MPLPPSSYPVRVCLYWPTRGLLAPFTCTFNGPEVRGQEVSVALDYRAVLHVGDETFVSLAWSRLCIEFDMPFQGDSTAFAIWAKTANGKGTLVDETVRLQNLLLDHLKAEFPNNPNIAHLRHFGPVEWPYLSASMGDELLFEVASPSLRSVVASSPITPVLGSLVGGTRLTVSARGVLRAATLVECGYPTEGVLIAISILDAAVQEVLMSGMEALGIERQSAEAQLRNVTQSRFGTYLDSLLMLVTGHSLQQDDPTLYAQIHNVVRARNNAIHRGVEVSRTAARDAVITVFDVLDYMNRVGDVELHLPTRPDFSSLHG